MTSGVSMTSSIAVLKNMHVSYAPPGVVKI